MNERDSYQVAKMLKDRGYMMTPEQAEADVILINTCSVRDMAAPVSYTHLTLPTKA